MNDIVAFRKVLQKNSLACDDDQIEKLFQYSVLLREWNAKVNLISRRDEENILERHIVHSLSPLFRFSFLPGCSILDLGTGGGLPGIPLAIICKENRFTLLDSIQKKMNAVNDIVTRMHLPNVTTVTGRAEEISRQQKYIHSFTYIVCRAVASMTELVRWGKPFLASDPKPDSVPAGGNANALSGGTIVLYKGGDLSNEMNELELKMKPLKIEAHSIVVDGVDASLVQDKKLVIIKP